MPRFSNKIMLVLAIHTFALPRSVFSDSMTIQKVDRNIRFLKEHLPEKDRIQLQEFFYTQVNNIHSALYKIKLSLESETIDYQKASAGARSVIYGELASFIEESRPKSLKKRWLPKHKIKYFLKKKMLKRIMNTYSKKDFYSIYSEFSSSLGMMENSAESSELPEPLRVILVFLLIATFLPFFIYYCFVQWFVKGHDKCIDDGIG